VLAEETADMALLAAPEYRGGLGYLRLASVWGCRPYHDAHGVCPHTELGDSTAVAEGGSRSFLHVTT
jgi:hypothetical protein